MILSKIIALDRIYGGSAMFGRRYCIYFVSTLISLFGCAKKNTDDESSPEPLVPVSGALIIVSDAIESAAALVPELAPDPAAQKTGTLVVSTLTGNASCYGITPVNAADTVFASGSDHFVSPKAPYYAPAYWYCALSDDGDHTIRGDFAIEKAILCSLGELKFDGSEVGLKKNIDVTSKCWPKKYVDAFAAKGATSFSTTYSAENTSIGSNKFDKQITLTIPPNTLSKDNTEDTNFHMLFSINDKHVAFVFFVDELIGESTHSTHVVAANLDIAAGRLMYESFADSWNPAASLRDGAGISHTRIMLQGAIASTGKISSLTNLQSLSTDLSHRTAQNNVAEHYETTFVSAKGNSTDGIRTHSITTTGSLNVKPSLDDVVNWDERAFPNGIDNPTVVEERKICFGSQQAKCTGNDGFKPASVDDLAFYLFPLASFPGTPGDVDPMIWAKSDHAFLAFEALTFAAEQ